MFFTATARCLGVFALAGLAQPLAEALAIGDCAEADAATGALTKGMARHELSIVSMQRDCVGESNGVPLGSWRLGPTIL